MITVKQLVLPIVDLQDVSVPAYAEFLSVVDKGTQVGIWYFCETENVPVTHTVAMVATDAQAPHLGGGRYIGTIDASGIDYHIFIR